MSKQIKLKRKTRNAYEYVLKDGSFFLVENSYLAELDRKRDWLVTYIKSGIVDFRQTVGSLREARQLVAASIPIQLK